MDALLLTLVMVALMVIALAVVARWWPRSSHLGGYRARSGGKGDAEPPVREDDDAHWQWTADPPAPGRTPEKPPEHR